MIAMFVPIIWALSQYDRLIRAVTPWRTGRDTVSGHGVRVTATVQQLDDAA